MTCRWLARGLVALSLTALWALGASGDGPPFLSLQGNRVHVAGAPAAEIASWSLPYTVTRKTRPECLRQNSFERGDDLDARLVAIVPWDGWTVVGGSLFGSGPFSCAVTLENGNRRLIVALAGIPTQDILEVKQTLPEAHALTQEFERGTRGAFFLVWNPRVADDRDLYDGPPLLPEPDVVLRLDCFAKDSVAPAQSCQLMVWDGGRDPARVARPCKLACLGEASGN